MHKAKYLIFNTLCNESFERLFGNVIGCLHDPANVQQTSSISTCTLNTFAESLLDVCWIVLTPHHWRLEYVVGDLITVFTLQANLPCLGMLSVPSSKLTA